MRIEDLGRCDGDLLLFGGPYSNLQALEGLIERARDMGIPPQRMICTGDVVAYGADPDRTTDLMITLGCPVVKGNCEAQLGASADDCGCGFEEGSACDLLSRGWYTYAQSRLKPRHRAWMRDRPDALVFEHAGRRVAVTHGGVTRVNRFLWPVSENAEFQEEIVALTELDVPVDMIIAGHSGIAFSRQVGQVLWVNAGVIGLPGHSGRPDTEFLHLAADGSVAIESLTYDAEAAHRAMVAAGLTQGYHQTLLSGYWPSEDILPGTLRRSA